MFCGLVPLKAISIFTVTIQVRAKIDLNDVGWCLPDTPTEGYPIYGLRKLFSVAKRHFKGSTIPEHRTTEAACAWFYARDPLLKTKKVL